MKRQEKRSDEDIPEPDAQAEERLVGLYRERNWLVRFISKRFGREWAEDWAQETFVRIAGSGVQQVRNPRGYLTRVAHRVAIDQHRRAAVRGGHNHARLEEIPVEPSCGPDQEQAILLKEIVLSLPPHLRDTFLLSRVAGLTYEQIAERHGLAVKTIEERITKALAHCAAKLRD
ncbi:RNA polymerase sigma factor [Phenylobacterium sp.]|uniref:RNA polymerase sigma factor n=1 Tax=Phenylobacterium sp. TaxID=1871053 RepID=UPI00121773B8|nr:RNA polymerase sigma factor [Phenylobacterium sp.]THD61619.1 MAG: RNA polymerase sigma factor [Phenylobacterium sp.]